MILKVYNRRHQKRKSPNWPELQTELLELIMKNLSFASMLRFKAVCSSWNSAAKSYATSFPQTAPWLMLPSSQENEDNDGTSTRCFHSLKENEVCTIKNVFGDFVHDASCVGSSHGWLVIMDNNANLHLLNPVSGRRIQLPLIWQLQKTFIAKAVLSSDPSRDNNFAVVIICGLSSSRLKFFQHAEEDSTGTWEDLKGVHREYCDVIFHNEQLFALAGDGSVEVWDLKNSSPVKTNHLRQPLIEEVDLLKDYFSNDKYKYSTQTYLVESLGEFLFVGRVIGNFVNREGIAIDEGDLEEHDYFCPYRTLQFYILQMNFTDKKLEKVEGLRDRALFLGGNQSMSLSTQDFPECEENSIYFTDDRWEEMNFDVHGNDNDYGGHDVGVYNIGNKAVKPFDQLIDKRRIDPPPFWIVPNPW